MDLLYNLIKNLEGGLGVILVMISHAVFVLKMLSSYQMDFPDP
jgi:hypothetical protein